MKNALYQPRFIHMQDCLNHKKFSGFTVAYLRTETQVFFAYSLVNKKDNYEKAIGRELSSETLHSNIDDIPGDKTNVDTTKRFGCMTIEDFRKFPVLTEMIGDRTLVQLNFMDFKHAFISQAISSLVMIALDYSDTFNK